MGEYRSCRHGLSPRESIHHGCVVAASLASPAPHPECPLQAELALQAIQGAQAAQSRDSHDAGLSSHSAEGEAGSDAKGAGETDAAVDQLERMLLLQEEAASASP